MIKSLLLILTCWNLTGYAQVEPMDIVINEVLFNPVKDGFDYVEGYNRSTKTIDLQDLLIANRNAAGDIASAKVLSKEPLLLPPATYFIITASKKWLWQHYTVPTEAIICELSSLPSFPDDDGTVILMHEQDGIIDELHYDEKWHMELIADPEGVALERINYNEPTQNKNNWTSASSSSGFGTPGFPNSHFRSDLRVEGEVNISPRLISPNNDGVNDFATIQFRISEPGYMVNLTIYDIAGRKVKYLLKNELLGINSIFTWHGEDDRGNKLPTGIYIVVSEIFNLQGKTNRFKHSIIIRSG
ncbi:MAG: gliding motility-associated C-terminal domain-containing protein [Chitinophagaceae bacterium]|nr:gliding motility-associated C-terminal domain-containing protein [Chitinophagaceae bacterium]